MQSSPVPIVPLDRYRLNAAEDDAVNDALAALQTACLHADGSQLVVPNYANATFASTDNTRRYGVLDVDSATKYGYHRPPISTERSDAERWLEALSPADRRLFFDSGRKHGCRTDSHAKLHAGVENVLDTKLTKIDYDSLDTAMTEPRVVAALRSWAHCMGERGFHYDSPNDAISDPQWDLNASVSSPGERAVAAADARCKIEVSLVRTIQDVETKIQDAAIANEAPYFRSILRVKRAYLRNAFEARNSGS